ncbi:MAG: hypothetical protein GY811_28045 [Myxococcales bacterium]|nr:hypothetical protein [Myxococcales bacterium]
MVALMGLSIVTALLVGRPWAITSPGSLVVTTIPNSELTLPLPSILASSPKVEERGALTIYSFGTLARSPVAVELVVHRLSRRVASVDIETAIAAQKTAAETGNPPNAIRQRAVTIVEVGDYPFVLVAHRMGESRLQSWITAVDDLELALRVYRAPGVSREWPTTGPSIVEGLAHPKLQPLPAAAAAPPVDNAFWDSCDHEAAPNMVILNCGEDIAIEYSRFTVANLDTNGALIQG